MYKLSCIVKVKWEDSVFLFVLMLVKLCLGFVGVFFVSFGFSGFFVCWGFFGGCFVCSFGWCFFGGRCFGCSCCFFCCGFGIGFVFVFVVWFEFEVDFVVWLFD